MRRLLAIIALLCSTVAATTPALAAAGIWQGDANFRVRLVGAATAIGESGYFDAGLEFELSPGWKVYWRSPGDAGLPPVLDFSASASIAGHHLSFPAPTRFSILGLESYGYTDRVILPLRLDFAEGVRTRGSDLVLASRLEGLVCKDVCIPVEETLTIALGRGNPSPTPHARKIAEFKSRVPSAGSAAGVAVANASIDGDRLSLAFSRDGDPLMRFDGDVFVEAPSGYGFTAPQFNDGLAHITITGGEAADLAGNELVVTAVGRDFLLEQPVTPAAGRITRDGLLAALLAMLGVAFLGGVVLNAMPCVLPVLSLKLASVLGQGGAAETAIRRSFVATACGVVASFTLLGLVLLAARSSGMAVGWGIQFQQPVFLALAAAAIGLFGLAMLDWITIPVPGPVSRMRWPGHGGLVGDFASGALATLLATPCSAPFVGTAIAFALAAPGGMLMLVFLAMGTGLASPWIAVAAAPRLVRFLPKPGAWMTRLRQVLALGLFGTTIWLLALLAGSLGFTDAGNGRWQPWQPGLAPSLAADGNVVFVDVTADWCITCQTNKLLVTGSGEVADRFDADGVVLLRADWTRPDAEIGEYLNRFGRFGVPFNAVYGPAAPDGIALPEILTTRAVVDAIGRARGGP